MHDSAGSTGASAGADLLSADAVCVADSDPRSIDATAMPSESSVMTASAALATDWSLRSSMNKTMMPKNAAADSVSHIGKDGERQIWSSDVAQAQFMREIPHAT